MSEEGELRSKIAALTKEQKTIFVILVFFGVSVVGLGILQIRLTMLKPFALSSAVPTNIKDEVNTIDALRYRDTDHDGLSDFEELYVYGTSPYIYDTFSYGMSDKQVLEKGLPLCPKGQDCGSIAGGGTAVPVGNVSSTVLGGEAEAVGEVPEDLNAILRDPAKIRNLLLQYGLKPEVLLKVSDSDLMTLVTQIINTSSTAQGIDSLNKLGQ